LNRGRKTGALPPDADGCPGLRQKTPARSLPPVQKNNPLKSLKSLHGGKAYIPVPREQEYVANHKSKNTEKEVITTSNKEKKVVAPAKAAPAVVPTEGMKSHGKRA